MGGDDADAAWRRGCGRVLDLLGAEAGVDQREGLVEDVGRAHDEWFDVAPEVGAGEGFGGDLRADADGVAEGNCDAWASVHVAGRRHAVYRPSPQSVSAKK